VAKAAELVAANNLKAAVKALGSAADTQVTFPLCQRTLTPRVIPNRTAGRMASAPTSAMDVPIPMQATTSTQRSTTIAADRSADSRADSMSDGPGTEVVT
jgi:hypothetical protein